MSHYNHSNPSTFILKGIPGLETSHFWIAFPFCIMYCIALLGNLTILLVIKSEPSLHLPMYYFLCMLAIIDMVLTTTTVPKALSIFWFQSHEICFHCCLVQIFFIHGFSILESGVLLAMAFDRYVAICKPLHYTTILTNSVIAKIGLAILVRGIGMMTPLMCMLGNLHFCGTNIVSHSYCEHMAVAKLACGYIITNNIYGLTVAIVVVFSDCMFIIISYVLILRVVIGLSSKQALLKSFGTCGSHICIILMFFTPALFSFYAERWGQHIPIHLHILIADLYLLVPPMLNPIIYGMKTKQIREQVLRLFCQKGT
ncbi:olfactory receptor 52K1 isoform X2 [Alligator mississippiensis]|uniref:olfactory receptor 52K1 isoform X2 n=1 Tax=Alligator mississippiensis TaxID=8496 RepID=UPI002877E7D7|nr:olfactory receptor 52K1 isoform X2 [Alligator mississippiensis]